MRHGGSKGTHPPYGDGLRINKKITTVFDGCNFFVLSLLLEGSAIGASDLGRVGLVSNDAYLIKRAVVLAVTMVSTFAYGTFNTLVGVTVICFAIGHYFKPCLSLF